MKFRIGPWTYRLRITDGSLYNQDGVEAAGLCDHGKREIYISGDIPAGSRLKVLLHELRHAWLYELGTPANVEDDCNNAGSFAAAAMLQLQAQGGVQSLMRLRSDGVIDYQRPTEFSTAQLGAQCGRCGGRFPPYAIATDPPVLDATTGLLAVKRQLFCEHCGHVQIWRESATNGGLPKGEILSGPDYARGEAVNQFIRQYPDACGAIST